MVCKNCKHEWEPNVCRWCKKGHGVLITRYARDEEDGTCTEKWKCSWCTADDLVLKSNYRSLPSFVVGYECPKCMLDNRSQAKFISDGKGCFLTTACVGFLGKPDDCYELQTLRNFRDSYVIATNRGKDIIDEYYRIAPRIVSLIDNSSSRAQYYLYIYNEIKKCISFIENKENERAITVYSDMVAYLDREFSHD